MHLQHMFPWLPLLLPAVGGFVLAHVGTGSTLPPPPAGSARVDVRAAGGVILFGLLFFLALGPFPDGVDRLQACSVPTDASR